MKLRETQRSKSVLTGTDTSIFFIDVRIWYNILNIRFFLPWIMSIHSYRAWSFFWFRAFTAFVVLHDESSWISYFSSCRQYYYYFFMPPPLGAGGIMFSGCPSVRPSVRSLKYPLLTCTWVRWSTRPTVTVLRHVRPSVRLSVRPSGEVSGHLPENASREWPEILHADVSWPSPELFSLWPRSVDFSNFGAILTWNRSNLGVPGISRRMHGGNGLKFCTLMYLDHLQNKLVYGHGLLILLILAQFWLSETGQIWGFRAFPGERMEEMTWDVACWCILTTFRTD